MNRLSRFFWQKALYHIFDGLLVILLAVVMFVSFRFLSVLWWVANG